MCNRSNLEIFFLTRNVLTYPCHVKLLHMFWRIQASWLLSYHNIIAENIQKAWLVGSHIPPPPSWSLFFLLRETDFQSQTHNLSFLVVGTCHCTEARPLSQKFTRGKRRGGGGGDKGFSRVLTKSIFLDSSQKFTPSIGVILSGIFYGLGMKASSVFLFSILLTTKEMSKANEEFC